MSSLDCDIAVVGGGPAGSVSALTLARMGYQVAMIEGSRYEHLRVGETLPPAARPLLSRLGLWEPFATLNSTPSFGNQSAWGDPDLCSDPFIFNPHGTGWHLDRRQFDSLLASTAAAAGARLLKGLRVSACTLAHGGAWRLTLARDGWDPEELTARGVIDATGRRAALAPCLGARRRVYDHLVGVGIQYRGDSSVAGFTLVEATEDGWWYSAPVPPDRMMVMFMTDADLCRSHGYTDPGIWTEGLARTQHTHWRVAGYEPFWESKVSSAVTHRLQRAGWNGRWLAVGDAAISVDPLSSSGILRALVTGELAGKAVAEWLQGNSELAHTYERWLDAQFINYWKERRAYYTLEKRWSDSPFWRRRIESETPLTG